MTKACPDVAPRPVTRRLDRAARRRQIVAAAAELFAAEGFHVPTRAIAEALGVTQALLYRYFASKEALVDAVFDHLYLEQRPAPDRALLRGPGPLVERVGDFYEAFFAATTATSLKVFLRAALDGQDLVRRYAPRLDERVLVPVLAALREAEGLPPPPTPLPVAERELALMLHGALVFLAIRRFVYGADLNASFTPLLRAQVEVFLAGAPARLRSLNLSNSVF